MDYTQGRLRRNRTAHDLKKVLKNAPLQFDEPDPVGFFGSLGWRSEENIFILEEANRMGMKMPFIVPWSLLLRFKKFREIANRTYGYAMFGRR
jgi:hypothetical protein